jgi:hypothetical protein
MWLALGGSGGLDQARPVTLTSINAPLPPLPDPPQNSGKADIVAS